MNVEPQSAAAMGRALTVSIVVPTRNSARTLRRCLESLRSQTYRCTVVVVDNFSTDGTHGIAVELADLVITAGPERSRQRNIGAATVSADVVGFVDSDMSLDARVVEQVVTTVLVGNAAVIVPERSLGEGYWARVRAYERSFYVGSDGVEAARFFRADTFQACGGYDEALDAGEDWDLTHRAARIGRISRVTACIDHDEGSLRYLDACRKKGAYAPGLARLASKDAAVLLQALLDRPYIRRPWRLLAHPALGAGLVALKAGESVFVLARLARVKRC